MNVLGYLGSGPGFSVELVPSRRGHGPAAVFDAVETILPFAPRFVDVTSHASEGGRRKSPGTFGLCAAIRHRYGVDTVPHVLCNGFTAEETEDALIELDYLGIESVLCLRGDGEPKRDPSRRANATAADLVEQVAAMNRGEYLAGLRGEPTSFCIGVAAYPEGDDIPNLLAKQRAGAEYAVGQVVYDPGAFLRYAARARDSGVAMPILPGLKLLTAARQLETVPATFGASIPDGLRQRVLACTDEAAVRAVGIDWARRMIEELLAGGAPGVHFYLMQNTSAFVDLGSALVWG